MILIFNYSVNCLYLIPNTYINKSREAKLEIRYTIAFSQEIKNISNFNRISRKLKIKQC